MRYRLRTLLILLAVGPPSLAWGWGEYAAWRSRENLRQLGLGLKDNHPTYLPPGARLRATPPVMGKSN
jgi:hypothetical protein